MAGSSADWWVAVVIDHWPHRSLGLAVFKRRPTVDQICLVLDEAARRAGRAPKYTVSDQVCSFIVAIVLQPRLEISLGEVAKVFPIPQARLSVYAAVCFSPPTEAPS